MGETPNPMIGQPLGCILVLLIGVLSFAIGVALLCFIGAFRPGFFAWDAGSLWPAFGIGFLIFYPLVDFAHRLEMRFFFRKHGRRILKIRGFRNHYRVDYLEDTRKMSGKWPKDFERWVQPKT